MPAKRWTTDPQFELLVQWRETHNFHQAQGSLYLFWPQLEGAFFSQFPLVDLCAQFDYPDPNATTGQTEDESPIAKIKSVSRDYRYVPI